MERRADDMTAPLTAEQVEQREAMADSVRGILQLIRNKPGATFEHVRSFCEARGDEIGRWPQWVQDAQGYVTEQGAALMIYDIMALSSLRGNAGWVMVPRERVVPEQLQAPCIWCGYNGNGYWQKGTHAATCPWHQVGGSEERYQSLAALPPAPGDG